MTRVSECHIGQHGTWITECCEKNQNKALLERLITRFSLEITMEGCEVKSVKTQTRSKSPTGKLTRKNLPKRAQNYSKEQLLQAMKKKKECTAKAQSVVERCLEKEVEETVFLSSLQDINQCHYDDIVEERVILHLCGYPRCPKELMDVPKKQFHISTHTNKVYDITERKNFCSNQCFRASNYIKAQLLTSPLWLRDVEDIPVFKVLEID
ncbi:putative RNA polymerase II subunit B1 CTD phosphatase RPAP2 homolog [Phlebotomus argentipes]|uniref:putative RNA polymerase II subunit B1 CTD phosphatase RPAP2 homolog n=1 Tax=Phlebotomus argentipes TaxID=94469 RepID=UPI0028932D0F|nr:putative RNA polymerase II subunit B1 CTD phosphatase RPAP2 homolog [Phlebotomus argentipes]